MRILGLDIGDKRIGVAISDPEGTLASPLTVILRNNDEEATKAIVELIEHYQVACVVIGLPRHLSGKLGRQAAKVQAFMTKLSEQTKIPIETRDEWLSSVAADRLLQEAGVKNRQRKARRDPAAAAFVLQGYLDSPQRQTGQ